jgi:DNA-binding response OmpR family regulator
MLLPHILSVGHDGHLMSRRSDMLREAGYPVVEAYSSNDAIRIAQSDAVDILLICHSVPRHQQRNLTIAVRHCRRLMPILCIIANDFAMPAESYLDGGNATTPLLDAVKKAAAAYCPSSPQIAA